MLQSTATEEHLAQPHPLQDPRDSQEKYPEVTYSPSNTKNHKEPVKMRHRIRGPSLHLLESVFAVNQRPTYQTIQSLAQKTGEDEHRIKIWFNNRRGKYARSPLLNQSLLQPRPMQVPLAANKTPLQVQPRNDEGLLTRLIPVSSGTEADQVDVYNIPNQLDDNQREALTDRILRLQNMVRSLSGQLSNFLRNPHPHMLPPISSILNTINTNLSLGNTLSSQKTFLMNSLRALFTAISKRSFSRQIEEVTLRVPLQSPQQHYLLIEVLSASHPPFLRLQAVTKPSYILVGQDIGMIEELKTLIIVDRENSCFLQHSGKEQMVKIDGIIIVIDQDVMLLRAACNI